MKRLVSFCLCMVMICMAAFPLYAQEQQQTAEENEIVARYVPCPSGGKHQLKTIGVGWSYSGSSPADPGQRIHIGTCGVCIGCGLYVMAENWPTGMIIAPGKVSASGRINSFNGVTTMFGSYIGEYYSLLQDDWIAGFDFLSAK